MAATPGADDHSRSSTLNGTTDTEKARACLDAAFESVGGVVRWLLLSAALMAAAALLSRAAFWAALAWHEYQATLNTVRSTLLWWLEN